MYLTFLLPRSVLRAPSKATLLSSFRRTMTQTPRTLLNEEHNTPQAIEEKIPETSSSSKTPIETKSKTFQQKGVSKEFPTPRQWLAHRERMKHKYPEGWNPTRKLSREAMDGIRMMHAHDPFVHNTAALAHHFEISPEAVRRILKSRWRPDEGKLRKLEERQEMVSEERKQLRAERKERTRKMKERIGGRVDDRKNEDGLLLQ
ncbi:Required for respiratory growth protein 9 mitochondrial [Tulasnella sp. 419]|nr:Required for respiratory growth protein 9 mitochondrial [Tulasnella sp. 419]